ncbi:MAG TPA: nuclear transport factor 2 family protein [Promineifilum sp.]|nr:nuclear transport factor 2 family protein [Promineifilum sp.]
MQPKEVTRLYLARHNAHDVEGVMALFAENACYEIPGRLVRHGKAEIRQTEEWEAAVHDQLRTGDLVQADHEVSFRAFASNEWLRAAGVDELRYTSMTIAVRAGHIIRITAALAPESLRAIETAH